MGNIELLVIGSNNKSTGGIPRYIPEQLEHLPNSINRRVYDIGVPEGSGKIWFVTSVVLALHDAIRFPAQSRPDIVHVHSSQNLSFYRAGFYILYARYVWRVPVLLHIHGSSFDEFVTANSVLVNKTQGIVYDASSEIVILSQYWKEQLEPYTESGKITIIPNAVNPDDYEPTYDDDSLHVVFISDLIERKGVNELTEALDTILDRNPDIRVSIAGKGPLSEKVAALAVEYKSVQYLGYVSEEKKHELLSDGSIYVLPAYAEGLPIAILEAMAGGNAIVSTTVGSIPEVIDTENGRLVPPKDVDALIQALQELIDHPEKVQSMGRRNRRLIETKYNWDVIARELTIRYETLTKDVSG